MYRFCYPIEHFENDFMAQNSMPQNEVPNGEDRKQIEKLSYSGLKLIPGHQISCQKFIFGMLY